ncbi:MAG: hypothetical protein EXR95_10865 [Gemmatimonadetes bacterium]|nr:hypothetical protein [Gemmatimonadota bacterium]
MPGRRGRWAAVLAFVVVVLGACDDPVPREGLVRATLVSPNGLEGAALFEVPVEGVLSVKARVGLVLESRAAGTRQLAVVLSKPDTIALELLVADAQRPPTLRLLQVSGPDDRMRALTGYQIRIEVPK